MDWFLHGGGLRLGVVVAIASGLRSLCVLQLVAGYLGLAQGLISIGFYFLAVFFKCWRGFVWAGVRVEGGGGGLGSGPSFYGV